MPINTTPACIVYSTLPDLAAAETIAKTLIERRLVACANILPGMVSIYRWAGQIERSAEVVMLLKTTQARAQDVVETLRALHPYDLPAITILPLTGGLPAYLQWIASETGTDES